ncbi:hypothetical protein GEV33_013089 [Tenebrio molitor]|uniref:Uncharacterized protein n=1 Tax=Tenebrio molitor TaxID=7067 RepID=A0A8J6H7K6_TENMO|nr:hypothetical protein GEV33_013089 [Tenebrio molitor]
MLGFTTSRDGLFQLSEEQLVSVVHKESILDVYDVDKTPLGSLLSPRSATFHVPRDERQQPHFRRRLLQQHETPITKDHGFSFFLGDVKCRRRPSRYRSEWKSRERESLKCDASATDWPLLRPNSAGKESTTPRTAAGRDVYGNELGAEAPPPTIIGVRAAGNGDGAKEMEKSSSRVACHLSTSACR